MLLAEHTLDGPPIMPGRALMVIAFVAKQPVGSMYEITSDPAVAPATVPDTTVALLLLLIHVPPPASVRSIVLPTHTAAGPPIAVGNELTVTTAVVLQPNPSEYVMIVVPVLIPETIPLTEPIVPIGNDPLLQVPPPVPSVSVVVEPRHTPNEPLMGNGVVLTVIVFVARQPPLLV
jgi:hypothetical protein